MVWVRGSVFKLELLDHVLGVSDGQHSSVMERDTRHFLLCVPDHQPGDHSTSAYGRSVCRGYGSFGVGVISLISRHSSDMERYTRLFLSCVLHNQLWDYRTTAGDTSVGRGYGSFWGRGHQLDLVSYGFETRLDFLMFFNMGPYMVGERGCVFKLEVMGHIVGVLSDHHYGVMEQETKLFLLCVLGH
ncbi:unnamed protein product [Lactuca virosa]|uniref:Uncharacterized protein n=1 Tax=Lactuca virosa TaxID=75947 RepID=A0AAU9LC59_9ASTR|nr:unnamed protein product [Lactuca virosa]